jgi:thymidylate synthase (FAD)
MPESIEQVDEKGGYDDFINYVEENYRELVALGVPNEDARMVLPNACSTSLYLSCNLRELIHICNERLCSRAQWEIRNMVKEMVSLVDTELHFMLVPKCKSGRIICHTPCKEKEKERTI